MFDIAPDTNSSLHPGSQRPAALQQSAEFTRALQACGQPGLVLPATQSTPQTLVLRRRVLSRLPIAMVNRASHPDLPQLLQQLKQAGLARTPLILSPDSPDPTLARLGAVPLMSPAHVALLPLPRDPDQRRAALHQKWRNRLNHAAAQPLRLTRQNMPDDPGHWLLAADTAQQAARGYRSWPVPLTLAYARQNRGSAKLFQAFEGRDPVAAMLILTHGSGANSAATYHIAHSTARGRHLSAHNLLMWEVMSWLSAKGFHQLDLGVINTEDATGLARWKLGTGAQLHRLGGTWGLWPPLGRLLRPLAALDQRLMAG